MIEYTNMKLNNNIKLKGRVKLTFRNEKTGEVRIFECNNLFVNTGLYSLAARLSGADVPANKKGTITYCAVGTGNTAANATDTDLETELTRKQIAVLSSSNGDATFRTYFNTSEAIGSLKEIGLFGDDATSVADSGTLFSRTIIDEEKTSSESLTIDWIISFSV